MIKYAIFNNYFFQERPFWMPNKLYRAVCLRSNPRSHTYMKELLRQEFPQTKFIETLKRCPDDSIILLYPDAIGLGWEPLEKKLMKQKLKILVLNGRKRTFPLTLFTHKKLLFLRFLEKTFLPEILVAPFLLLYGLFLTFKDKIIPYRS